jgi:hypothetical protein
MLNIYNLCNDCWCIRFCSPASSSPHLLLTVNASEIIKVEINTCHQKEMSNIYKQPDFIELRNKVPNVKCSVLICDDHQCTNYNDINTTIIDGESISSSDNRIWLLHLKCKVCNNAWSICTICSQFKKN